MGVKCVYSSAMNENESSIGRKYGKVGILYRAMQNALQIKLILFQKGFVHRITFDHTSILLFNVYMPYDVGRPSTELDECKEVLAEIKTIIST